MGILDLSKGEGGSSASEGGSPIGGGGSFIDRWREYGKKNSFAPPYKRGCLCHFDPDYHLLLSIVYFCVSRQEGFCRYGIDWDKDDFLSFKSKRGSVPSRSALFGDVALAMQ